MFRKNYAKRSATYLTYSSICLDCHRAYDKKWRSENNKNYNHMVRDRRNKNKLFAIEYKGGKCEHCGQVVHQAAFDFHHLDDTEKEMDLGLMLSMKRNRFIKELDKCILLCSNCHRVHHFIHGYK